MYQKRSLPERCDAIKVCQEHAELLKSIPQERFSQRIDRQIQVEPEVKWRSGEASCSVERGLEASPTVFFLWNCFNIPS